MTSFIPSIVVIGSLNTDLITRTSRIPEAGETLAAESFSTGLGGKGANQAVACQRLSHDQPSPSQDDTTRKTGSVNVRMVGAVGADEFGKAMCDGLRADGLDVTDVRVLDGERTGIANVIVEEETGQNRILIAANANGRVLPDWFDNLPAPIPNLIVMQLEIPLETVLHILHLAAAHEPRVPVVMNPAPAAALPEKAYGLIHTLVLNESEAGILSGKKMDESAGEEELRAVCQGFIDRGVKAVILTLGGSGCYHMQADGASGRVSASEVQVVDTTAAGDTFIGAYAVKMAEAGAGLDVGRAVAWANRCAGIAVGRRGAQSSIPWRDEVSK